MSVQIRDEREMLLKDNLWRVMAKLSWPAILAMVLYGLNSVFDAIFVGRYVGASALAGVSYAYPLSQVTLGIGSLIGVGAGSVLSIAIGANDKHKSSRILGNVNYLSMILSLFYVVLCWLFAEPLVKMMGGSGQALTEGVLYFRITVLGALFWVHGLAVNMVIRSEGRMKSAALMMGIGLIINIFANTVFIVWMGMGVGGAAWGTNLGMFVYSLLAMLYFKSGRATFDAKPFQIRRDPALIKEIVSIGVPSLIMTVMTLVQGIVVFNALSRFGSTSEVAFYGASYRVFMFLLTPIFGLMRALQPCVGINFGAKQYRRVRESFKVFAVGSTVLVLPLWLILLLLPETVLGWMLPNVAFSPENIFNFRIFMTLLPLMPVIFLSMTFFPAIGKGKPSAIMGIVRQLVFYIPVMLILPRIWGVQWVYFGSTLIDIIIAIWVFFMVNSEFKILKRMEIAHQGL